MNGLGRKCWRGTSRSERLNVVMTICTQRVALLDREDRMLAELAMSGTTHRRVGASGGRARTISRRLRRIGRGSTIRSSTAAYRAARWGRTIADWGGAFFGGHSLRRSPKRSAHLRLGPADDRYIRTWHQATRGLRVTSARRAERGTAMANEFLSRRFPQRIGELAALLVTARNLTFNFARAFSRRRSGERWKGAASRCSDFERDTKQRGHLGRPSGTARGASCALRERT